MVDRKPPKSTKKQCLEDIKKYQDLTRECKRFYREQQEQELKHYREEIAKLEAHLERNVDT